MNARRPDPNDPPQMCDSCGVSRSPIAFIWLRFRGGVAAICDLCIGDAARLVAGKKAYAPPRLTELGKIEPGTTDPDVAFDQIERALEARRGKKPGGP